jgi:hypothetical protein
MIYLILYICSSNTGAFLGKEICRVLSCNSVLLVGDSELPGCQRFWVGRCLFLNLFNFTVGMYFEKRKLYQNHLKNLN